MVSKLGLHQMYGFVVCGAINNTMAHTVAFYSSNSTTA